MEGKGQLPVFTVQQLFKPGNLRGGSPEARHAQKQSSAGARWAVGAAGVLHHWRARMTLFLCLKIMARLGFPNVNKRSS